MSHDLDIEPIDAPSEIEPLDEMRDLLPAIADAPTAVAPPVLALAEVLPASFPLPALVRWVPDIAKKQQLDVLVTRALSIDVQAECGMGAADEALAALRAQVIVVEGDFDEPKRLAHELHKSITGRLSEWLAPAKDAIAKVGREMAGERRRQEEAAAKARREAQAEADRIAREAAQKAADAAKQAGAPAPVVEQMQQQAAVATAPPVPVAATAPAPLAHSTVTKTWKARIAGTPADANPTPSMAELTPAQQHEVRKLMAEIVAGRQPLTMLEIPWATWQARARAEKSTLAIPGIEAYEEIGTRAKAGRRV
jgi:hypothetical protein